jgi:hypothetical protein
VRIALEAKRLLGLPIDESDYAGLETKETKLRNVTNMENYVKNVASSYGRDSGAMMDEMLKLNGCESVAELQEKVANGESIIEAADTAWNAGIQKQHYAAYDAMIAARNAEAGRAGQAGSGSWYEDVARSNNGGVNLSGILNPNANYSGNSEWRANTEPLNIGSGSGYWIEPNPEAAAWAMNFDFGRDFGARAGQHFSNGEYAAGALNLMAGTGEAMMNTAAIAGAAFLVGAGVNAVTYMASVEGRLMAAMAATHVSDKMRNASWDLLNKVPSAVNNIQRINYAGMGAADGSYSSLPTPNASYFIFNKNYRVGWITGFVGVNYELINERLKRD